MRPNQRAWAQNVVPFNAQTSSLGLKRTAMGSPFTGIQSYQRFPYSATERPRPSLLGFLYIAYGAPEIRVLASQTLPRESQTCRFAISHAVHSNRGLQATCWDPTISAIGGPDRYTCYFQTVRLGGQTGR